MLERITAVAGLFCLVAAVHVGAQSLNGSTAAMLEQHRVARQMDYSFIATGSEVRRFAARGLLVDLRGSSQYKVANVSYPYARPAVKLFVERLADQYANACGEKLVITSLTRPLSRQPWNAHELSVHPAGMAVDLRVSRRRACRTWLEQTLRSLEARRVIEATRERRPAHYHIAVYPVAYAQYVAGQSGLKLASNDKASRPKIARIDDGPAYASILPVGGPLSEKSSGVVSYKVRVGDTLWSIARRHDVTVTQLRKTNRLARATIRPGQVLQIPGSGRATASSPAR